MRVVVDTNIIVSGLFWKGSPEKVYSAAIAGQYTLLTTETLIAELERVLHYPKFAARLDSLGINAEGVMAAFKAAVEVVSPAYVLPDATRDPNDAIILACAVGGNADVIVSGDKDLLVLQAYRNIPIVDVAQFLERLAGE